MADNTNSEITVINDTTDSSHNAISPTSKETMTTEMLIILPETNGGDKTSPTTKSPTTSATSVLINLTPPRTSILKTVPSPDTSIQQFEVNTSQTTQPSQPLLLVTSAPSKVEKSRRNSEVASRCPICQNDAVKKKNTVLKCSTCSNLVHFPCSNLPAYMLYSLSSSQKKYVCEVCTATPEPFLTSIVTDICNSTEVKNNLVAPLPVPPVIDNRYDIMENKMNSLSVILEKFDLQSLAENLNQLGNKLETTSNNVVASMKEVKQLKKEQSEAVPIQHDGFQSQQFQEELNLVRKDLEFSQKELSASRIWNELLMKELSDRDAALETLRDRFEKNIEKHGEKDKIIATLEAANKQLRDANTTTNKERSLAVHRWGERNESLVREKEELSVQVEQLNERIADFTSKYEQSMEINSLLKSQLDEAVELNKSLQTSFNRLSTRRNVRSSGSPESDETSDNNADANADVHGGYNDDDEEEDAEKDVVIILHDSMCKRVNPTLLSKEKIEVKKVWAPDMNKMEEALDRVNSNVVVLESWTRDLERMEVADINQRIRDIVSKALTKAEKVVITTIINRTDVRDIDLKVDSVNSFIKLNYMRHESVIVCDNHKLYDDHFRIRDRLHLTDDGVSLFASNLKYAIAKGAGVRVVQKHGYDQDYKRYNQHRRESQRDYRRPRYP